MKRDEKLAEADRLEAEAKTLRESAAADRKAELRAKPLLERLVFAAHVRCECGAGMAYDPASDGDGVFKGPHAWECSDILRYADLSATEQARAKAATHTGALPFYCYEIKSENQPSAGGATTRPPKAAA